MSFKWIGDEVADDKSTNLFGVMKSVGSVNPGENGIHVVSATCKRR